MRLDWYGILQLEEVAADATIRKQYRKFALHLHPDKNKFAGTEAAFKLIWKAQRVLLDREKGSMHHLKHHASVPRTSTHASDGKQPSALHRPPQKANMSDIKTIQVASKVEVRCKGTSTSENDRPDVFRKTQVRPEKEGSEKPEL